MSQTISISWRFGDGYALLHDRDGFRLTAPDGEQTYLSGVSNPVMEGLMRLNEGASEAALFNAAGDQFRDAAQVLVELNRFKSRGFLVAELWAGDTVLATCLPRSQDFDVAVRQDSNPACALRLSRFAYLRRMGDALTLECPEASCAIRLNDPNLVLWLHAPEGSTTGETDTVQQMFAAMLADLGFLVEHDAVENSAQRTWEFQDRLFHHRTRIHNDFQPYGGTYRFHRDATKGGADVVASPPAIRPAYAGETIALPVPRPHDSDTLRNVMERRRSRRDMGEPPVSIGQVAELLYRVARIREVRQSPLQDCVYRPYPSGGAIHELEFYLVANECDGLLRGFYHYRGDRHVLTRLPTQDTVIDKLIGDCASAWGKPDAPPQCLILLSSRLPRLAWKYEAVAYRVTLLNAGVVLQSLQLVCTDLGLHGAPAGSGRPGLFAVATGNTTWEETSVAEFGFGSADDGSIGAEQ